MSSDLVQQASPFKRDVVQSVAMSCLLAMDYVPNSKPPPLREMVSRELPRVLSCILKTQGLGGVEVELHRDFCDDPAGLLERVEQALRDVEAARNVVRNEGHHDAIFSAVSYMRKAPTATCARIEKISRGVARELGVAVPEDFDQRVGDAYDEIYGALMRV